MITITDGGRKVVPMWVVIIFFFLIITLGTYGVWGIFFTDPSDEKNVPDVDVINTPKVEIYDSDMGGNPSRPGEAVTTRLYTRYGDPVRVTIREARGAGWLVRNTTVGGTDRYVEILVVRGDDDFVSVSKENWTPVIASLTNGLVNSVMIAFIEKGQKDSLIAECHAMIGRQDSSMVSHGMIVECRPHTR